MFPGIVAKNLTSLFKKEMLLYSFFDIKFQRPVRIAAIGYTLVIALIWAVPIFMLLPITPITLVIAAAVPIAGGMTMAKPIWGGKNFLGFAGCIIKYAMGPKAWYEHKAGKKDLLETYKIDHTIYANRQKDYTKLFKLIKAEKVAERNQKKGVA
jgi:hypothetical protein